MPSVGKSSEVYYPDLELPAGNSRSRASTPATADPNVAVAALRPITTNPDSPVPWRPNPGTANPHPATSAPGPVTRYPVVAGSRRDRYHFNLGRRRWWCSRCCCWRSRRFHGLRGGHCRRRAYRRCVGNRWRGILRSVLSSRSGCARRSVEFLFIAWSTDVTRIIGSCRR